MEQKTLIVVPSVCSLVKVTLHIAAQPCSRLVCECSLTSSSLYTTWALIFCSPTKSLRSDSNQRWLASRVSCSKISAKRLADTFQISTVACWISGPVGDSGHELHPMRVRDTCWWWTWGRRGRLEQQELTGCASKKLVAPRGMNSKEDVWKPAVWWTCVPTTTSAVCLPYGITSFTVCFLHVLVTKRSLETSSGIPPGQRSRSVTSCLRQMCSVKTTTT